MKDPPVRDPASPVRAHFYAFHSTFSHGTALAHTFEHMAHRSAASRPLHVLLATALTGLAALTTMGCEGKRADTRTAAVNTPATNELAGVAVGASIGEQRLDTSTPVAPTPANRIAPTNAPLTTTFRAAKARKPGSDENLPKWVPLRGRLTVVEAPDLAENLGLVPKGATKSAEGRISVAELMANGSGAATASADAAPRSATWLASNSRVRHGRGR